MRSGAELEQQARDLAGWLQSRPDGFLPLRIVRVDSSVDEDDDEPAITLTVVLEDPADLDKGWPVDAVFQLYRAVRQETADVGGSRAHVHLQAVSDAA